MSAWSTPKTIVHPLHWVLLVCFMIGSQFCFSQSAAIHQSVLTLASYNEEKSSLPTRALDNSGPPSSAVTLPDGPLPQSADRIKSSTPYDSDRLLPLLIPADNESNNDSIELYHIDVGALQSAYQRTLPHRVDPIDASSDVILASEEPGRNERYHWDGLLKQSLFFNVFESAWRYANDDQIRYLMLKKPFWHDYVASVKQFNMRRWNDGDPFIVNYVGHPMQGAVAAYIEIQNDPVGRQTELSATHDYWMSRFKGFLWATLYSTHSEISPLGEAGIGNEGGWTYPKADCKRPCPIYKPGVTKYTNNTGWVDFIITPTVGMLWLLAEDTLDRYVSDWVQGDDQTRIFPKILRGSLNPSRTFANFMRLKKPWYRDFQHHAARSGGIHMLRSDEDREAARLLSRFAIGAYYRSAPFGISSNPCGVCFSSNGFAADVDYALNPWLSATVAVDKHTGVIEKAPHLGGSTINTSVGLRLVRSRPQNTFSFVIRPGVAIEQITAPAPVITLPGTPERDIQYSVQHPTLTLAIANDYKVTRTLALRSSFGATITRYRTLEKDPPGIGQAPYYSWLSHDIYANHTTWIWEGGPVFRF